MEKYILSIQKCETYDITKVLHAIKELVKPFGGIETFVKPGNKVLLKPNMLSCKEPDKAATTHSVVVEAVAMLCKEAGAIVQIGDSPPSITGRTKEFWEKTGFARAAEHSGSELICFESQAKRELSFMSNGHKISTYIVQDFFDVDVVINLPKMKTHNLTRITGAVKNLFGLMPGMVKAQWHKVFPRAVEFSNFIVDLSRNLPCALTIMDGIEAMDGQGPAGGRVVRPGILLAAESPVTVDMGFCAVVGLDPDAVPYMKYIRDIAWGPRDISEIEVVGSTISDCSFKNYNVPKLAMAATRFIPDAVLNFARKMIWTGPKLLQESKCIKCGRCKDICPVDAIVIGSSDVEFNRDKCVSCFCCMEVCPVDTIEMSSSPLLTIYLKVRDIKRHMRHHENSKKSV